MAKPPRVFRADDYIVSPVSCRPRTNEMNGSGRLEVMCVAGARPNFVKLAPIVAALGVIRRARQ